MPLFLYKRKSMKQEYITDTILTNTIAALNEQISALQSALNNLQATVNSKVSQDDFNSLQSVVNTKASQSSLDSLSNTNNNLKVGPSGVGLYIGNAEILGGACNSI